MSDGRRRWGLTAEERFWRKVQRRGPHECWPWIGACGSGGYGAISVRENGVSKRWTAHRRAWVLVNGPIPARDDGQESWILHTCDYPPCVNPAHLKLGTPRENTADMIAKGRQGWRRGRAPGAKKPPAQKAARDAWATMERYRARLLADESGAA